MNDHVYKAWLRALLLPGFLVGATLTIGGNGPLALPLVSGSPTPPRNLVLVDGAKVDSDAEDTQSGSGVPAPLAELTEVLAAARAKLEQLDQATAALAGIGALRAELSSKQEENRRLVAEVEALRARRVEWQRADDAARAKIAGLGQALDEAAADIKKLDGELTVLRTRNAELGTSLGRARSNEEAVRAELGARVDELMAKVEAGATEMARLNEDLTSRRDDLVTATEAQLRSAARASELEDALAEANDDLRRLGARLTTSDGRLKEVTESLAASEQERDAALGALDEERARADRFQGALLVAEADLEQARAVNRDLEIRSASLEQAATVATETAWQNLRAVEGQIAVLNSTLAEVELLQPEDEPADTIASETAATARSGNGEVVGPASDQPAEEKMTPGMEAGAIAPAAGPTEPTDSEIALVKLSEPAGVASSEALARLAADLSAEGRIQAHSLLAELDAKTDQQGLKLVVPGAEVFSVNSEEVESTAHDSLAKVAELINLYKDQPVTIIGHTDAVGMTDENKRLSLRRAEKIREFLIENFNVDAKRLATQGMGEQQPIASNATAEGRRANRRVEVLILK